MKKEMSIIAIMITLGVCLPAFLSAQVDTVWVSRWTSPGAESDWAYDIAVDNNGHAYVAGKTNNAGTEDDWTTIKHTQNGDTAWVRNFASPGSYNERASSIVIGPSGNIYITGYTMSTSAGDYLTIKYKPNGDTVWTRRYNGVGNGYDFANWVTVDPDENVYVTGYSRGLSYQNDIATVKYDSSGQQQWVALFNGSGNYNDEGYKVIADDSGYVYVVGQANPNSSGTRYDYVTVKYHSSNGGTVWSRTYNGSADSSDIARDVEVDGAGNVYVTGSSRSTGTMADIVTIKYTSAGDTAWIAQYNNPDTSLSDAGYGIETDGAGNVYVVGQSQGLGTGSDIVTIKYDENGNELWVKRYNGPNNDYDTPSDEDGGKCLTLDQDGNVYIIGTSSYAASSNSRNDYITIMYSPDSVEQWAAVYNCCDSVDAGLAIAVDTMGGVYVCGRSVNAGTYYDMAAVKYQSQVGVEENTVVSAGFLKLEVSPNPFSKLTKISFGLEQSTESALGGIELSVYDAAGRRVKDLYCAMPHAPCAMQITWDGTDAHGKNVPNGVYFFVLNAGGNVTQEKIVMVR